MFCHITIFLKLSASQPGCTCTPWGEFEKLRGETLKKGELAVNYTRRGEVVIGQIVCCKLYNAGLLSFQITLVPSIKSLVDRNRAQGSN